MIEFLHDFLFPVYRLNWFDAGPSSPNKTGTFLTILFLLSWWPSLRFRQGFWISLPVSFILGILLIQTESRGAIVALVMGLLLFLSFSKPRMWERRRIIACIASVLLLCSYSHWLGVSERFAGMASGNDGSANVRVKLYTAGLQMISSAPFGWGSGTASSVYQQWYQVPGDDRTYLSLINSHLTWMAEFGLIFQVVYIFAWLLILFLCLPIPRTPLRITSFACWMALGVGAIFSSVLTLLWLWLIPLILLVLCLIQRFREQVWPQKNHWTLFFFTGVFLVLSLHGIARVISREPRVVNRAGCIHIGDTLNGVLIIKPDAAVLGELYGQTIRSDLEKVGSVSVLTDMTRLKDLCLSDYSCILLSGDVADLGFIRDYAGLVVFLNPHGGTDLKEGAYRVRTVVGGMGDWRRVRRWEKLAGQHPDWEIIVEPNAAEYIPDWMNYCIKDS